MKSFVLRKLATNPHDRLAFSTSRGETLGTTLQLHVLLIALSCKAQSAVEELVQEAQQFHLAVDVDRAAYEALALQGFPEGPLVRTGENNCPAEVGARDPLRGTTLTNL